MVDKSNGYFVSAFITSGNILFSSVLLFPLLVDICFLLLHQNENEEKIRQFFVEVNQLYIRVFCLFSYDYNVAYDESICFLFITAVQY